MQETYLKAYRSWATFSGENLPGWLHTILRNTYFNAYRAKQRRPQETALPDDDRLRT